MRVHMRVPDCSACRRRRREAMRELSNFNGHQESISFHTMANENFVVMNRFSTHASGPGVLKRRDA
jgi:hypothetical protein